MNSRNAYETLNNENEFEKDRYPTVKVVPRDALSFAGSLKIIVSTSVEYTQNFFEKNIKITCH